MLRKSFQILTSLIVILSVLASCTTREPEYFYIEQLPIELPLVDGYLSADAMALINMEPQVITEPVTVNDLLYDLSVYKEYYEAEHEIRISLEKYIKDINMIIGEKNDL